MVLNGGWCTPIKLGTDAPGGDPLCVVHHMQHVILSNDIALVVYFLVMLKNTVDIHRMNGVAAGFRDNFLNSLSSRAIGVVGKNTGPTPRNLISERAHSARPIPFKMSFGVLVAQVARSIVDISVCDARRCHGVSRFAGDF